ncbi:MAG: hypothetical protein WC641_03565 [Patescibacteria group bacterium]
MVEIIAYIGIFLIGLVCGAALVIDLRDKRKSLKDEFLLNAGKYDEQRKLDREFREWCRNRHPFLHSFVA